ncbi:MAG: hypothetical protein WBM27_03640 [bacterium]
MKICLIGMTLKNFSSKSYLVFGTVILAGVLNGCTATRTMLDTWEDRRQTLSRGLADLVDATDRAFGESRVRDEEEIVQVRIDINPVYYHKEGFDIKIPVKARIPLPAIERKAKFFFQIGSSTDPRKSFLEAGDDLVDNRALTSGFLYDFSKNSKTGVKIDTYWRDDRPQLRIRPFVRLEINKDPLRFFFEEQVLWRSDEKFGTRTSFHISHLISDNSFLRFAMSGEYGEMQHGIEFWCAIQYRHAISEELVMSTELGSSFNPHYGAVDKKYVYEDISPGELDRDKLFSRLLVIGKFPRKWMEYAIEPGLDYYFHHEKPWDYGVLLSIRIIVFEAFLRESKE